MTDRAPAALPLRVRGPRGGQPILLENLTSNSTFYDLESAVRQMLSIPAERILTMLAGFPPSPLMLESDSLLGSVLRANEIITVREGLSGEATIIQGHGAMKTRPEKKKRPAEKKGPAATFGSPNIHTLHGGGNSGKKSCSSGRGLVHKRGSDAFPEARSKRSRVALKSEEDVGDLLLASVSRGGVGVANGRINQCMRAVFRKAVEKQYDESKAESRVASAEAGLYVIEECQDYRKVDGTAGKIKISYHKGHGFRSDFQDEVELLSKAQLLGVVAEVLKDANAREMLKPLGMAGCSPRVYWSLLYQSDTGHVAEALRQLLPQQDWSFLHERMRKLSEKAQENVEQEEELKRLKEHEVLRKRQRREARLAGAQAKMMKSQSSSERGVLEVVVPQQREEEDVAVVDSGERPTTILEEEDSDFPELITDEWVKILARPPFNLRCARDLAGADAESLVQDLSSSSSEQEGAPSLPSVLCEKEVQAWISECQSQELDVIMMDIVEQEEEVLECLELVHVATPKDLKLWKSTPNALMDTLSQEISEERWRKVEEKISVERILEWGRRAEDYLARLPWLDLWASE